MFLIETAEPAPSNFGLSEPVAVGETTVYLEITDQQLVAEWVEGGLLFNVVMLTTETSSDGETLREEAVRAIESIIDQ